MGMTILIIAPVFGSVSALERHKYVSGVPFWRGWWILKKKLKLAQQDCDDIKIIFPKWQEQDNDESQLFKQFYLYLILGLRRLVWFFG